MRLEIVNAANEKEIELAFAAAARANVDAVLVAADPFLNTRRDVVVSLAAHHAIPAVYPIRDFTEAGGLISYGASLADAYRQLGIYAGKLLQGAKPTELPVVQPTKIEMVINLRTAKMLGIAVPPTLIARADEVIE